MSGLHTQELVNGTQSVQKGKEIHKQSHWKHILAGPTKYTCGGKHMHSLASFPGRSHLQFLIASSIASD